MADLIRKNNKPQAPKPDNSFKKAIAAIFIIIAVLSGALSFITDSLAAVIISLTSFFISFVSFMLSVSPETYNSSFQRESYGEMGERRAGAVYFANPRTGVNIIGETDNMPVFTYASTDELIEYILSGKENLSDKKIMRILELLE